MAVAEVKKNEETAVEPMSFIDMTARAAIHQHKKQNELKGMLATMTAHKIAHDEQQPKPEDLSIVNLLARHAIQKQKDNKKMLNTLAFMSLNEIQKEKEQ